MFSVLAASRALRGLISIFLSAEETFFHTVARSRYFEGAELQINVGVYDSSAVPKGMLGTLSTSVVTTK